MLNLKVGEILDAVNGELIKGNIDDVICGIFTDSRAVKPDDFFIPIIGENFDGHDFIDEVIEKGAVGYITSREDCTRKGRIIIKVEDTLKALQNIASFHRERFNIPIIAVTGSCGKTSTKDMIYSVLSKKYNVLKTKGNKNNHIGLPLTLLELSNEHQAGVVEMGMSSLGEISLLSKLAKPHIAVITNIGTAHIGELGSRANILKAKMEIFDGMDKNGIAVLNGDDPMLYNLKGLLGRNITCFGLYGDSDIKGYDIKADDEMCTTFNLKISQEAYKVYIPVPGMHNVYNALAAIAVGLKFRVPIEDIIQGIKDYKPEKMRMNVIKLPQNIKVINDTYNANPSSMEEALKVMKDMHGSRKIAVLGDMLELGVLTRQAHIDIGKSVVKNSINYLITLGESSRFIAQGAAMQGMSPKKIISFNGIQDANRYLSGLLREGDVILVKGSRGMKMEGIVDFIVGEVQNCISK